LGQGVANLPDLCLIVQAGSISNTVGNHPEGEGKTINQGFYRFITGYNALMPCESARSVVWVGFCGARTAGKAIIISKCAVKMS